MKTIIGLCGPAGAGKDTAFKGIQSLTDEDVFFRRSFADPIRAMGEELLQVDSEYWEPALKDKPSHLFNNHTPREFLIDIGMLGRKYYPNIWLDRAMRGSPHPDSRWCWVFTDVRFTNEAQAIKAKGGVLIEIAREGAAYNRAVPSEAGEAAKLADAVVDNLGTPEELGRKILLLAGYYDSDVAA